MRGWVTFRGFEGYVVRWSQECSGCTNTPEMTMPDYRGLGCDECGYTGRSRRECFVPFDANAYFNALSAEPAADEAAT